MDYLDTLRRFAAELDLASLPPAVREQTSWVLADTLASIVGGSAEPELRALAGRLDAPGVATLIGLGRTGQPDAAALLNGTAGTFLEMDEGNRFSRGHPAVHVLPAALALSEASGASADVFMAALLVGYEVGSRFGAASRLRPGGWLGHGGHARDHQHRRLHEHRHLQADHAAR